jgi:hypothetical protein
MSQFTLGYWAIGLLGYWEAASYAAAWFDSVGVVLRAGVTWLS